MSIRAIVVDDHDFFRRSIRSFLGGLTGVTVVGDAGDGVEAVAMVDDLAPDLVVMDVRMPRMDGVAASVSIRARHATVKVILFSLADTDSLLARCEHSADVLIAKDRVFEDLRPAIDRLFLGS